jgi:succinyl-CoA synthetase beta subunit
VSRLLEFQIKSILSDFGISSPEGQLCNDAQSAKDAAATLGGVVYVKAQVRAGDRAAVGAVRRCEKTDDVAAVAQEILDMTVSGLPVEGVLVEEAVDGVWFGYAAVSIAEDPARRILRFSTRGGVGFDPATAELEMDFDDARYSHRIRRALREVGVASNQLVAVTTFLSALVDAVATWSAYTIEVNPVVYGAGGVIAVDAKADLDDYSKHLIPTPTLLDVAYENESERRASEYQAKDYRGSLRYVQLIEPSVERSQHYVASHSVGGGESMIVLDALATVGLLPTNYCDTSGSPSVEKVAFASALVAGQPHIAGLLFSTCIANQRLSVTAEGLLRGWDEVKWRGPSVVRFAGNESEEARALVLKWATERSAPVLVIGEESDEWAAAALLAELLENSQQVEEVSA